LTVLGRLLVLLGQLPPNWPTRIPRRRLTVERDLVQLEVFEDLVVVHKLVIPGVVAFAWQSWVRLVVRPATLDIQEDTALAGLVASVQLDQASEGLASVQALGHRMGMVDDFDCTRMVDKVGRMLADTFHVAYLVAFQVVAFRREMAFQVEEAFQCEQAFQGVAFRREMAFQVEEAFQCEQAFQVVAFRREMAFQVEEAFQVAGHVRGVRDGCSGD